MAQHWLKPDWEPGLTLPYVPIKTLLDIDIQAIVLDVDGTLLPGRESTLSTSVKEWVANAQKHLSIHLLSNNPSKKRIGSVAEQLGITFTCGAAKPRRNALKKVLKQINLQPSKIAIVGDRVFTDILVGNRVGLYTVLVRPIHKIEAANQKDYFQSLEKKLSSLFGVSQR